MANAVFNTKPVSQYDDAPEERYNFPKTYLRRVEKAVGDWIIYYEPRRADRNDANREGRQVYFAMAQLDRIEPDSQKPGHHYAIMVPGTFLEFAQPVAFRQGGELVEESLKNMQSSTREIPRAMFERICRLGMTPAIEAVAFDEKAEDDFVVPATQTEYSGSRRFGLFSRPIREAAFSQTVGQAYGRRCAMTGLSINSENRWESQAAHIRPVEKDGPDSPRNGISLSRTVHWLFDEGFLSLEDDGRIKIAENRVPEPVVKLLNPDLRIHLPLDKSLRPHPTYLRFHRDVVFKGRR